MYTPHKSSHASSPSSLSAAQCAAVRRLRTFAINFCAGDSVPADYATLAARAHVRGVTAYGEEVCVGQDIVANLVALPPDDLAARVDLTQVASPALLPYLHDSESVLKPRDQWPRQVPRRRVYASCHEYYQLVKRAYQSGLFVEHPLSEAFSVDGVPVLTGAFAVPKDDVAQRLILWPGCNDYHRRLSVEDSVLPYPGHLSIMYLRDGETLLTSADDIRVCFYAFRLPETWRRFFVLARPVPGWVIGKPSSRDLHYVAVAAPPMGYINSVDLIQGAGRVLAARARLDPAADIRPDLPFPRTDLMRLVYVDNNYLFEKCAADRAVNLVHSEAPEMRDWRAALAAAHVPLHPGKRVDRSLVTRTLGLDLDGGGGTLTYPVDKRCDMVRFIGILMTETPVSTLALRGWIGRYIYAGLVRRPVLSVLSAVFRPAGLRTEAAGLEFLLALSLLPVAVADLRAPFLSDLYATDASLAGGAVVSTPLPEERYADLLSRADLRGSAVRLDGGPLLPRRAVPGTPFPCSDFNWRLLFRFPWLHSQHISILEGQVVLALVRHLARNTKFHGHRFGNILDAAAPLGYLAKQRSSSSRANTVCKRVGAMLLAAGLVPLYAWTDTGQMPADRPSRPPF